MIGVLVESTEPAPGEPLEISDGLSEFVLEFIRLGRRMHTDTKILFEYLLLPRL
jgi:hypothetical protein